MMARKTWLIRNFSTVKLSSILKAPTGHRGGSDRTYFMKVSRPQTWPKLWLERWLLLRSHPALGAAFRRAVCRAFCCLFHLDVALGLDEDFIHLGDIVLQ